MKTLIFMTVASMLLASRAVEAQTTEAATSSSAAAVETSPEPSDEPGDAPKSVPEKKTADVKATPTAAYTSDRAPPLTARPYYLRGTVQFRTLAVNDDDPANGRSMIYAVELGYRIDPQLTVFARTGILQRFVVPSGDTSGLPEEYRTLAGRQSGDLITSPFLLRDSVLGAAYRHSLKMGLKNGEMPISFAHYLNLYFPTSISSQDRGLYFAPEAATRARVQVLEKLSLGVDLGLQYRFHKYAEQFGPNGGLLTQYQLSSGFAADYNVADFGEEWGRIDAGGGIAWVWQNTFESGQGGDHWRQDYGWDAYVFYTPKSWLSTGISLEQGAPVLRYGRVNSVLFHRDEMELVFTVQATY